MAYFVVRISIAISLLLFVVSCSKLNTASLGYTDGSTSGRSGGNPFKCRSSAGVYALSRTVLTASITFEGQADKAIGPTFNGLGVAAVGDPDHRYCLNYGSSPTSEETIRVTKTTAGLLQTAASNIRDQSRFILESIIETIFVAISGAPGFTVRDQSAVPGATEIKFVYEFDPFDYKDTARFNSRANDFGFCVIVPLFTFNHYEHSIDQYCNNPLGRVRQHAPDWHNAVRQGLTEDIRRDRTRPVYHEVTNPKLLRGLLYRPKFPYPVYLLNKVEGRWVIKAKQHVLMENVSPILSIGVEGSAFARRTTALRFRDGVLEGACVYNSAGITEFINVPLAIARGLIRLPAEIIKVDIGDTKANTALAQVEKRILLAQQKQFELLANPEQKTPGNSGSEVTLDNSNRLTAEQIAAPAGGGPSKFVNEAAFVNDKGEIDETKCPPLVPATGGAIATAEIPGIATSPDADPPLRRPHVAPRWRANQ